MYLPVSILLAAFGLDQWTGKLVHHWQIVVQNVEQDGCTTYPAAKHKPMVMGHVHAMVARTPQLARKVYSQLLHNPELIHIK
jgi:hypothetical protein